MLDSIRNSCNVFLHICLTLKHNMQMFIASVNSGNDESGQCFVPQQTVLSTQQLHNCTIPLRNKKNLMSLTKYVHVRPLFPTKCCLQLFSKLF